MGKKADREYFHKQIDDWIEGKWKLSETEDKRLKRILSTSHREQELIEKLGLEVIPLILCIYDKVSDVDKWPKGKLKEREKCAIEYVEAHKRDLPLQSWWRYEDGDLVLAKSIFEDKNLYNLREGQEKLDFTVAVFRKVIRYYFGPKAEAMYKTTKLRPIVRELFRKLKQHPA